MIKDCNDIHISQVPLVQNGHTRQLQKGGEGLQKFDAIYTGEVLKKHLRKEWGEKRGEGNKTVN